MTKKRKIKVIKFNGNIYPVYEMRSKIDILFEAANLLNRLCNTYENLGDDLMKQSIEKTKERIKPFTLEKPIESEYIYSQTVYGKGELEITSTQKVNKLQWKTKKYIRDYSVEETIDKINEEFDQDLGYNDIIDICGKAAYEASSVRECHTMKENFINEDQILELWNQMGRPDKNGNPWTLETIEELMYK